MSTWTAAFDHHRRFHRRSLVDCNVLKSYVRIGCNVYRQAEALLELDDSVAFLVENVERDFRCPCGS